MPVNFYFQSGIPGVYSPEQNLVYNLIDEAISIKGVDTYYIPRKLVAVDFVFTEDVLSKFEYAFPLEMYLENTQGYDGDSSFLSKFGVEIQQSCSFTVSRRRWEETVGTTGKTILSHRPTEGDIIYFPLTQSMFEITKVVHDNPFYQLGKLYTYRLDCQLFQYSSERFDTGITKIDDQEQFYSMSEAVNGMATENDLIITDEEGCALVLDDFPDERSSQNAVFETEAKDVVDFTETNPWGEFS